MPLPDWAPDDIDPEIPSSARVYDYILGGVHHLESDRRLAQQITALAPDVPRSGRANRAFLRRAVTHLVTEAGITQFLDLGSGIPTVGNVHEVVHTHNPDAHVVYVDIDPVAIAMSRRMLADTPAATAVRGDFNAIEAVLTDPEVTALLDFSRPVAVLAVALLHFMPDQVQPIDTLARLRAAMAPGSYLVLSHAGNEGPADQMSATLQLYQRTPTPMVLRSRAEIAALLDGFDLVDPGLVYLSQWRPDPGDVVEVRAFDGYAGIGRIPTVSAPQ
ncbi:SAM-dependent methyltransferase [Nocardia sp. NPDC020380]|uniref:SAM-dependent methyltransferase n=1 Tax=Nocardia sp. NPDC020380 TaxID=3364309 RepID=UPI0037AC6C39